MNRKKFITSSVLLTGGLVLRPHLLFANPLLVICERYVAQIAVSIISAYIYDYLKSKSVSSQQKSTISASLNSLSEREYYPKSSYSKVFATEGKETIFYPLYKISRNGEITDMRTPFIYNSEVQFNMHSYEMVALSKATRYLKKNFPERMINDMVVPLYRIDVENPVGMARENSTMTATFNFLSADQNNVIDLKSRVETSAYLTRKTVIFMQNDFSTGKTSIDFLDRKEFAFGYYENPKYELFKRFSIYSDKFKTGID